jgi:hypothetical protein
MYVHKARWEARLRIAVKPSGPVVEVQPVPAMKGAVQPESP